MFLKPYSDKPVSLSYSYEEFYIGYIYYNVRLHNGNKQYQCYRGFRDGKEQNPDLQRKPTLLAI